MQIAKSQCATPEGLASNGCVADTGDGATGRPVAVVPRAAAAEPTGAIIGEPLTERISFPGAVGRLAGELAYPLYEPRFACLLLNPHPLMGGSADNNIIRTLALGLAAAGCITLRFDYGGVGESRGAPVDVAAAMAQFWQTGHAPNDPHMIDEGRSALACLRSLAAAPVVLIGYSFGAFVASRVIDERTAGAIVISPTLRHHDLRRLREFAGPRLVVYSDNDFATPRDITEPWISSLPGATDVHCVAGGEHFFRGAETQVLGACARFVDRLTWQRRSQ